MSTAHSFWVGPKGGTLVELDTVALFGRKIGEGMAGRRGGNPHSQFRDGHRATPGRPLSMLSIPLEVRYRYSDPVGDVTHTDASRGHAYENMSTVKRLLRGTPGTEVTLRCTVPHWGEVEIDVELNRPMLGSETDQTHVYMLDAPHPYWRSTTLQSGAPPTLAVGGNALVDDPVLTFTGGVDAVATHGDSGMDITVEGTIPAGGVRVDVGERTAIRISDGADWREFVTPSHARWFELYGDYTNPISVAGGGTLGVDWYNKWQ